MLPGFPGANIKEFWPTILSEAKWLQTQCLSPKCEFWVCSEANSRMVQNYFQRAKGNSSNSHHSIEAKKQRSHILKYLFPIKSKYYENIVMKTQETLEIWVWHYAQGQRFPQKLVQLRPSKN